MLKIFTVMLLALCAAHTVPAAPAEATGSTGFKPLMFKGKPFFLLSDWDSRRERNHKAVHVFLKGAGMNTFMAGVNFLDDKQYAKDMSTIRWFRDNHPDLAVIVDLPINFVLKTTDKPKHFVAVPPELLKARREKFIATLKELRTYGNVLGYSIDELENRLYNTLGEWKKTQKLPKSEMDVALTRYMEFAIGWVTEDIKKYHPESIYIPVQAWWTTYDQSDKLYDVLIANDYPVPGDQTKKPTFYTVANDAQKAAAATRKFGKRCFVYCPPGYNILGGRWKARPHTRDELRYLWFTPISSGAMGIIGWRFRRTTEDFAMNTVIPIINEIKSLEPWLLGPSAEHQVKCNRTHHKTEYKILKRSRMTEKEDNEYTYRTLNTITWIARRNPTDGSMMLLACNNNNKPEECFFVFSKDINATYCVDVYNGNQIKIGGRFKVKFKPYDVKVFIFPAADRQAKP